VKKLAAFFVGKSSQKKPVKAGMERRKMMNEKIVS